MPSVVFESCVESFDAARASAAGGASRIELCARLDVGGTTPAADLVARCTAELAIPVFVMVRPRGGNYVYTHGEALAMARDVRTMKGAGAHGIVCGALTTRGLIDTALMRRLIDAARPFPVTCHRAVDDARHLSEAIDALLALGVDRVLTSGGAPTAIQGAAAIGALVRQAGDALTVIAGGGVRAHNVAGLVHVTGVTEVHARLLPSTAAASPADADAWRLVIAAFAGALPGAPASGR